MRYSLAISTVLVFCAVLVVSTGKYLFQSAEHLANDTRRIAEGQQTLLLLEQILSAVKDAETGQRGFVLTGDETYLEPYNISVLSIDSLMVSLQPRLPKQTSEYLTLQRLVQKRFVLLTGIIQTRRQRGFTEAQGELMSKGSKIVMDSIRAISKRLQHREEQATAAVIAQNADYFRNATVAIIGGSCTLLLLLAGFAATMSLFVRYRAKKDAVLQEQRAFTQSILSTVPSLMLVFDMEKGGFHYVNTYFEKLLGYTPEEMTALGENSLWAMVHPDDFSSLRESSELLRKAADNTVYEREYRIRHKDGSWRSFTDRAVVFRRNEQGEVRQILAFLLDITDRVRAEEELKRSEMLQRSIVNTPLYSITVLEAIRNEKQEIADFRFVLLNDVAAKRLQKTPEELQQLTILQLLPTVRHSEYFARCCDVVISGNNAIFEAPGQAIPGSWGLHTYSKLNDGLVITSYDITDRKAAEEKIFELNAALANKNANLERLVADRTAQLQLSNQELLFTNQQLEETNKELESFSYSVSHDLRAPLRTVNGFAEMLRERYAEQLDDEAQRLVGKISHGAQKMGVLIDELLALSRLGRKTLQISDVDMTELVRSVVADDLNSNNELSAFSIEIASLPNAACDAGLLRQVWFNLLSNAVKYSRNSASKIISVTSFIQNDNVVYTVRDEGVGFDMRYADKLFNVFQRLHKERDFEGTGIGLAIVKRVITKHGGTVWVEAEPNKGATFYFSLSRAAMQSEVIPTLPTLTYEKP